MPKKEKLWNVPNIITISRIIATFFIVYLILINFNFIATGIIFIIFAVSDAIDGTLARKLKQTTTIGARLDQVADRIYFGGVLIALLIIPLTIPKIHILLIISREIVALPAFLYLLAANKEFVKTRTIGKITTVLQATTTAGLILKMPFLIYPIILTGFFGIIAGLTYWYDVANARAVKYVKKKIKERGQRKRI